MSVSAPVSQLLQQAGQALQNGQAAAAEPLLQQALRHAPNDPQALVMMAAVRLNGGDPSAAYEHASRALAQRPNDMQLTAQCANYARLAEKLSESEKHFNTVLGANASEPNALFGLCQLYLRMERLVEAEGLMNRMIKVLPNRPEPVEMLGIIHGRAAEHDKAVLAFKRALTLAPNNPNILANLSASLLELGEREEALRSIEEAARLQPDMPHYQLSLASLRYDLGEFDVALGAIDRVLQMLPGDTRALALKSGILDQMGDDAGYDEVMRFDEFMMVADLEVPEGWGTIEDLNAAVVDRLLRDDKQQDIPKSLSAENGTTVLNLNLEEDPFRSLAAAIQNQVDRYRENLLSKKGHPFLLRRNEASTMDLWGVVLRDGGFQNPHHHRAGWLSGCYYPQVPNVVREDDPDRAGWIEFGRPDISYPTVKEPRTVSVTPKAGRLVLFPSFYWHRTIPFHDETARVSTAFDIIPIRKSLAAG